MCPGRTAGNFTANGEYYSDFAYRQYATQGSWALQALPGSTPLVPPFHRLGTAKPTSPTIR
jgi:hypothetical protein